MFVQLHCLWLCNATGMELFFDFVAQLWDTRQPSSIECQLWEWLIRSGRIVSSLLFLGKAFVSIPLSLLTLVLSSSWAGHTSHRLRWRAAQVTLGSQSQVSVWVAVAVTWRYSECIEHYHAPTWENTPCKPSALTDTPSVSVRLMTLRLPLSF